MEALEQCLNSVHNKDNKVNNKVTNKENKTEEHC